MCTFCTECNAMILYLVNNYLSSIPFELPFLAICATCSGCGLLLNITRKSLTVFSVTLLVLSFVSLLLPVQILGAVLVACGHPPCLPRIDTLMEQMTPGEYQFLLSQFSSSSNFVFPMSSLFWLVTTNHISPFCTDFSLEPRPSSGERCPPVEKIVMAVWSVRTVLAGVECRPNSIWVGTCGQSA